MLTDRQETILANLIRTYIHTAEPVASADLALALAKQQESENESHFSSPTIRNEFRMLDKLGYLHQPHTAAGRVPTNKGYRYFIDELMEPADLDRYVAHRIKEIIAAHRRRDQEMFTSLLEAICRLTHSFGFVEQMDTDELYTFGFSEVTKQPEFEDQENVVNLAKVIDRLQQEIDNFDKAIANEQYRVFIGAEHPMLENTTSVVVAKIEIKARRPVLLGLLGPTRMDYPLEVSLIEEVSRLLREI